LSQKYYDPFTGTETDYKLATGKEILCYLEVIASGGISSITYKIWAGTTKDSKSGARDVFGKTFIASVVGGPTSAPPFILKAGEYLNLERVGGTSASATTTKIVGVERDAT